MQEDKSRYTAAFEDVIAEMAKLYADAERQFLSFNRIVPYNHNPGEVYSPRLYTILQSSSAQIISMMAAVTRALTLSSQNDFSYRKHERQKKFEFYYNLLNKYKMLSVQKLAPKEMATRIISPFLLEQQDTPKWWQAYNDTKHDLPEGAYNGTIGNVMNALGALTILHDISQWILTARNPIRDSILQGINWKDKSTDFLNDYESLKEPNSFGEIMAERPFFKNKSRIFFNLTEFVVTQ